MSEWAEDLLFTSSPSPQFIQVVNLPCKGVYHYLPSQELCLRQVGPLCRFLLSSPLLSLLWLLHFVGWARTSPPPLWGLTPWIYPVYSSSHWPPFSVPGKSKWAACKHWSPCKVYPLAPLWPYLTGRSHSRPVTCVSSVWFVFPCVSRSLPTSACPLLAALTLGGPRAPYLSDGHPCPGLSRAPAHTISTLPFGIPGFRSGSFTTTVFATPRSPTPFHFLGALRHPPFRCSPSTHFPLTAHPRFPRT